jgi:hypothetical protein
MGAIKRLRAASSFQATASGFQPPSAFDRKQGQEMMSKSGRVVAPILSGTGAHVELVRRGDGLVPDLTPQPQSSRQPQLTRPLKTCD